MSATNSSKAARNHCTNPVKRCTICADLATVIRNKTHLCDMHYRTQQMRVGARVSNKAEPSALCVNNLAKCLVLAGMKCPVCDRVMNWLFKDGRSTVVTLQHDRDGTIRLMCKGCNSKHHWLPGDSFYDLPEGHKRCPKCGDIKPRAEFYPLYKTKTTSLCRVCSRKTALARHHAKKGVTK